MNKKNIIPVSNHYAFSSVFTHDLHVTREFISALTGKQISRVSIAEKEKVIEETAESKGIRFDVYLKDSEGESFDLELQLAEEKEIEKRIRYYQSVLTSDALLKGEKYRELRDSYVIFISTEKDPMKMGKTVYEIGSVIRNQGNAEFRDGMHSYIFNFSKGREKSGNGQIEEVAEYFYNGEVKGKLTERIDRIVSDLNQNRSWREKIMTFEQEKQAAREEGYQIGKDEGKAEGLKEGRLEGKAEGLEEGKLEEKKRTALTMLEKGVDIGMIAEITELKICEIEELKK